MISLGEAVAPAGCIAAENVTQEMQHSTASPSPASGLHQVFLLLFRICHVLPLTSMLEVTDSLLKKSLSFRQFANRASSADFSEVLLMSGRLILFFLLLFLFGGYHNTGVKVTTIGPGCNLHMQCVYMKHGTYSK